MQLIFPDKLVFSAGYEKAGLAFNTDGAGRNSKRREWDAPGVPPTQIPVPETKTSPLGWFLSLSSGYEIDEFADLTDGFELSEIIVVIRKANHHPQF